MNKLRVLVLMHEDLVPPESIKGLSAKEVAPYKSEYDVSTGLENLGHEVRKLGVSSDLGVLRNCITEWNPDITFNLLEEFHGVAVYDQHVVGYLELMRKPYTGCNPRGLLLAHDKALTKQILSYHRIRVPDFAVFPQSKVVSRPKRLKFPLLVKSVSEEGSVGISQASVVHNEEKLAERVAFIHQQTMTDAIAEEFIEGRELYVGLIGNDRLEVFPVWEMFFHKMPEDVVRIATEKVKWDHEYQKKHGIETGPATNLEAPAAESISRLCKRVYRALSLSGYARMDLRLTPEGQVYVLEANPNPNLEYGEDFSESAEKAGISYEKLLSRIVSLGLAYKAPWQWGG
ncbi:MAG: ATP-grasp domain-containing protein [Planctomycetia bacterium]|nr:ATP-grasp domain-containing protein [Planctomycetia bacterium]